MIPRLVIAAPNSSSGKTTIGIGLMAALRARGLRVAGFKIGPDYIDPGYHSLATGRPGRNLDCWLCGPERIAPLFVHGARDAEIAIVEGVMGLYDGRLGETGGRPGFGSTAHVAELIAAPVLLVLDASGVSRTLAATAHGLAAHPEAPRVAGVICNRVGSPRAADELRDALARLGLPVLGMVPRNRDLLVPSRHLGLVPAAEREGALAVVEAAAGLVGAHVDLAAVLAAARSAGELAAEAWSPTDAVRPVPGRPRIAVAAGRVFTFRYAEHTELLAAAGCEVVEFDPLTADRLPRPCHGLYIGGGFPEVYAGELAANRPLLAEVRAAVAAGLPTVAECAGLLYLCHTLDGADLAGAVPLSAAMTPRLVLGYRELTAVADSVLTRAQERYRSHEFHRTATTPLAGTAGPQQAWQVTADRREGVATASLLACYQHLHWAGAPRLAQRFARAAAEFAASGRGWPVPAGVSRLAECDLRHHGDAELAPGLVDLAVNVRPAPDWLLAGLTAEPRRWQAYPDARPARAALAARHGVPVEMVLPTAGAAEAFTLIARQLAGDPAVVVHPQFTEPEAALRAAGRRVRRLLLRPEEGFRLAAGRVGADARLVLVGNPTNPTGVLHPAAELRRLVRPGRVVVVDEAFMDFVPGQRESLIAGQLAGLLVVRSLTKLWGIPGLRAGYLVGDPELIARLARDRAPWAVSTPALDAMVACCSRQALAAVPQLLAEVARERAVLVAELAAAGFEVVPAAAAPFVLVSVAGLGARVPEALAEAGFAVRSCASFPGLGSEWLRLAVRDADTTRRFVRALVGLRR